MNRLHVLEGVGDKRPLEVYDIDDVLLKSRDGFVKISHQEWGHDPDIVKYKEEWDRWWGISHAETKKRSDYIWEQGLPLQFEPLEDAPEGLAMIARRARIVLLTSRPIIAKEVTIASIERHFDTSCIEDIVFAGFYDNGSSDHSYNLTKAGILRAMNAIRHTDDQPKHVNAAVEQAEIEADLMGVYSWHESAVIHPRVVRTPSWQVKMELERERAAA